MQLLTHSPIQEYNLSSLDTLVAALTRPSSNVTPNHLTCLIEESVEQLESDNSFEPEIADQITEALDQADLLLCKGQEPWQYLEEMLRLYQLAQEKKTVERTWNRRAEIFTASDLNTDLWAKFMKAIEMLNQGETQVPSLWLDHKAQQITETWESYTQLAVAEEEINLDTHMCHTFLREGTEAWIEALSALKDWIAVGGDIQEIVEIAEWGQRQLLAVQSFESETMTAKRKYFVNFN